jgi:hypothetical protein
MKLFDHLIKKNLSEKPEILEDKLSDFENNVSIVRYNPLDEEKLFGKDNNENL